MRINNNLMAMNTHRQLGLNNAAGQKSIEKLSSGLRINRAGDDAAGLSISEKMRGQIRGLNQASRNAQDGISLIQTAEGALQETQAILQRMRELSVQSANDTNVNADRSAIQGEFDALAKEISRIADTTEFNTQNLLGGNFKGTFQIGANKDQNLELSVSNMSADSLKVADNLTASGSALVKESGSTVANFFNSGATVGSSSGMVAGVSASALVAGASASALVAGPSVSGMVQTVSATTGSISGMVAGVSASAFVAGTSASALVAGASASGMVAVVADKAGYYSASDNSLYMAEDSVLDANTEIVKGIDVSSQTNANNAIETINSAIETVSAERSKLGAYQNRLEHTIKNLDTSSENLQASESRIRDVDMAKEMMEFTKNNILQQAAQAMLAQANQAPQGVLQLLR